VCKPYKLDDKRWCSETPSGCLACPLYYEELFSNQDHAPGPGGSSARDLGEDPDRPGGDGEKREVVK